MSETKMTDPSSGPRFCPECGSRLEPDGSCSKCLLVIGLTTGTGTAAAESLSLAPEQIPGYRLEERVGQGGMGVVWRAHHLNLQRTVAIKVLAHSVRGIPGFAERFHREARTMAGLSHRNVVTIHDFGETDGLYWLVMEYVDGLNLRELMNEVVAPRRALKIVTQICEALDYAHEAGIVHRDIKPENVLVDAKGQVKLGDFGLAKLLDGSEDRTRLTGSRHVMGTPHYMAPEQVNAPLDVDHRADIFSLGVVFYELLTGELPMGNFAPPSQENDTDPRLDEVVLRALHHKPADRYQRASEVKDDITAVEQAPGGGSTGSADLQIRSDGDAGSARKAGADLEVRAPVG
ncbi:MAG: hypothetical protein CMJ83_00050, partial [Planctomycetes bacterium]|nr:hypothetical protein [Planctomycetota bacterium]